MSLPILDPPIMSITYVLGRDTNYNIAISIDYGYLINLQNKGMR